MEQYRSTAGAAVAAGAVAEAVGAVIIPGDGETLKVHGLLLTSDLASGGPVYVGVQETVNSGGAWAYIMGPLPLIVANGIIDLDDTRFLVKGLNYQPRSATSLQYRLVVVPDAAATTYVAALRGRTEK